MLVGAPEAMQLPLFVLVLIEVEVAMVKVVEYKFQFPVPALLVVSITPDESSDYSSIVVVVTVER
jgi:hypothetical protein